MKKAFTAIAAAVILLSGCNGGNENTDSSEALLQSSMPQSSDTHASTDVESSQPAGEKTFLIGADGLTIYTSEITEARIKDANESSGERILKTDELGKLNEETFSYVCCEGFAYVHDSRINLLAIEAPDKFENGVYTGAELPPSQEYLRLRTGDKIGELTVRSAETEFSPESELAEHGYFGWSTVRFDGELTITGYLSIIENPLYEDGIVRLAPAESLLPQMFQQYAEGVGISHMPVIGDGSYSETAGFNLGYLGEIKADMNGLKTGDMNVKVRVTIGDIRMGSTAYPTVLGELLSVEKL